MMAATRYFVVFVLSSVSVGSSIFAILYRAQGLTIFPFLLIDLFWIILDIEYTLLVFSPFELILQPNNVTIKNSNFQAAVGWPVSELLDRNIADYFNAPSMLDDGDRVPTVLNGGMDRISPQFWGFCLGLCASIDMYGVAKARKGEADYFPGNLGFDPLNFYAVDKDGQKSLQTAEIKHGRVAMLGVVGYAAEEYTTQLAVIEDTPILFQPITESIEEALLEAVQFEEAIAGAL